MKKVKSVGALVIGAIAFATSLSANAYDISVNGGAFQPVPATPDPNLYFAFQGDVELRRGLTILCDTWFAGYLTEPVAGTIHLDVVDGDVLGGFPCTIPQLGFNNGLHPAPGVTGAWHTSVTPGGGSFPPSVTDDFFNVQVSTPGIGGNCSSAAGNSGTVANVTYNNNTPTGSNFVFANNINPPNGIACAVSGTVTSVNAHGGVGNPFIQ